ncbi:MAG: tetratricopeptide repeat protein [Oligoflexales bacterium]|nr:tetratricopeptide repeat protein [Oligoflexales bacterium]
MEEKSYNIEDTIVLVVDDQELIRKSIAKVLEKLKIKNFTLCSNGAEAIKDFSSQIIDLVILDIYMEPINGFEVLETIRNSETNSDIPVIVVTGESCKDDIVKTANLGAEDYLLKPFQPTDLEKKIIQVLKKYNSPETEIFYIRKSERKLHEGDIEEAKKFLAKALKINPKNPRSTYVAALLQYKLGNREKAIDLLSKNIKIYPSYLKNYVTLANIYIEMEKFPEAISTIISELELNPKQFKRQAQLAKLLEDSDDYSGAIEHYRQSLLENVKSIDSLMGMGRAYAKSNNLEKAIYYFKRIRRYHPSSTKALEAIVKYALAANNPRIAEVALIDEKKTNPNRLDTYVVLSKFYANTENTEAAQKIIEEVLAKKSDFIEALAVKAALHFKLKEFDKAETVYRSIIEKTPDTISYLKLSEILIQKGSYSNALGILHKALQLDTQVPQIIHTIAVTYAKTEQFGKALFSFLILQQMGLTDEKIITATNKMKNALIIKRKRKREAA